MRHTRFGMARTKEAVRRQRRSVAADAARKRAAIAKGPARVKSVEEVEAAHAERQVRLLRCARARSGPKLDCEMRTLTDFFACVHVRLAD